MDFSFSDAQNTIRDLAREILEAEVTIDRVRTAERSADWMDEPLWRTLAEAKLLGIAIPKRTAAWAWASPNCACCSRRSGG